MSEGDSIGDSVHGKPSVVYRFFTRLGQIYQSWLDKSTPYTAVRWVVTLGLSFVYMIRVYLLQMTGPRYQRNRTKSSGRSFGGFQSLNFGTRPPRASWWPWSARSSRRSMFLCSGPSW
ncbi:retention in endoplasmic reticulum sorting receptor 1 [Rhinolophus ferrumequinum]|uniref:Protein RER1 n=1 Tax=Rhinolophus ferrumequinum TaxID=59479 RepID=A0A671FBX3_RHIFE|nr:retention in endoplasmic reticulum sorting receptor 1 [Rhinolophus ferrumequinum]